MGFLKKLTLFAAFASLAAALPYGERPPTLVNLAAVAPTTTTAAAASTSSTSVTTSATSISTSTSTSTSTASTSTSTSTSTGNGINIVNNLDQTVYLWSTSDTSSDMQTLTSGSTYTETWRTNSDGGGISIKMATSTSESSVLQFEYTKSDETLWWDLSSINLDSDSEFITSGFAVTTDDSSCTTASCAAGDTDCADSYQNPDDVDTRSCSASAAFTMTIG
ncbi:antigenic thaumatin domain protein [Penicillium brasilianum]|uniref:Antigenic thaumatin domain protein n=1 Tax=Penicillium brasilianum TaxID=104259 RepID=A0A1S9RDI1_PENBI|nr:antigenic thaumatin domain protein [Penicillium brasilianum]